MELDTDSSQLLEVLWNGKKIFGAKVKTLKWLEYYYTNIKGIIWCDFKSSFLF